ncbi:MAG: glutathionylspermidine synthase family protein [Blastocatellia bacterium]
MITDEMEYERFSRQLYETGILADPWIDGERRFSLRPLLIGADRHGQLAGAAESIGAVMDELARLVVRKPELLDDFYGLTEWQKAMWSMSEGRWHGIARVDLFLCTDGRWRVCEVNSDTPSGEAEAVVANRMIWEQLPEQFSVQGEWHDPNRGMADRFWEMLVVSHTAASGPAASGAQRRPGRVGLIYPTDLPEDLSLVALYRNWLTVRGCEVVTGSPYNLGLDGKGRVTLLGQPVDLVLRHYKTDWWGERQVVWRDQEPYADPDPLERELSILLPAELEGRVTVVNPFGSVITQNKHSLALLWEYRSQFSAAAQQVIEDLIPETRRLVDIDPAALSQSDWVLKSVYGCEGDSVIVGPFVTPEIWKETLDKVVPEHWVAQRFFEVEPYRAGDSGDSDCDGWLPNYGLYLIAGRAAGLYTRLSREATDYRAVTMPSFVKK